MEFDLLSTKNIMVGVFSVAGGVLFGQWDLPLRTLVLFMLIDYATGLMVAFAFKNSPKTEDGRVSSSAGYKGIMKKGMGLLIVLVAYRLDLLAGSDIVRNTVITFFIANEAISINENAILMGVDIPSYFTKFIHTLRDKEDNQNNK